MKIRVGILTAPHIEWEKTSDGFVLHHVRIGIGFHWDREEDQTFQGELEILHHADGTETAVNIIDIEDYLCSVISSEMSTHAPMELLKAHAVISRSWAIRAMAANQSTPQTSSCTYESNGHVGFDVCADDHCQRYEGTKRMNHRAVEAVRATAGQVLMYGDEICDCRFHKCCGGKTEVFETCWEDTPKPYLQSVDCPYCGTVALESQRQALNDYDLETRDFHDWTVTYTRDELDRLVREKTGIDFGEIVDLVPLRRGKSGRIYELEIIGTRRRQVISKELKIRRALSPTCLYSSWFDIASDNNHWTFRGHGWGHGVGLCQIGATQMAVMGKEYEEILHFYYQNSQLKTIEYE